MSNSRADLQVVITGMGMVTSLGLDVATSCAAARAGIVRASKLDDYPVRSPDDGSVDGVTVHAVSLATDGFEGESRLLRLAEAALKDLNRLIPNAPWRGGQTGFYLSIPDANRCQAEIETSSDREGKSSDLRGSLQLMQRAAHLAEWPAPIEVRSVATSGSTGVAEAFSQCLNELGSGRIDFGIVGGIDSLLDEDTLGWLHAKERLKSPDFPSGLQPGEAAGFLLVERWHDAKARKARIYGLMEDFHFGKEPCSMCSGNPSTGTGLAEVLLHAAEPGSSPAQGPGWVVIDHNGEAYRGLEWGNALFRISSRIGGSPAFDVWYPAGSFGDTGAAFGVVAVCMCLQAFARCYAPSGKVTLAACSEGPARASLVILSPEEIEI